ncbi:hypothetical protein SLEP1_g25615 [Rubroshorea leprosula]|uniref:Reverse transcriptase domain-containing protein n=1 Tax=Rubroshorea leprosula TaxID=152421 RepID=A0AAV5JTZ5_9ROSI|nr:hypothetical protein SLEP1_g25615 [Rubroshorea leprosula]
MDYETLLIPFHFPQARFLFKDQRLPVPILDSTLAQILLGISNQSDWMVKIISWNCRGAAKHNFHSSAMDLKRTHNPAIMLVVETKLSGEDARSQAASLGFAKSFVVNSNGLAGGLWLLWDDAAVVVDIVSYSDQAIHAIIKVCNNPSFPIDWFLSGIYGRPQIATRTLLWNELSTIAENISMPWMMIGDFNDVLDQSEKFGGNRICQARVRAYLECMNNCNMIDLGFVGNRFTWVNMRFSHHLIRERLDRAWANPEWKLLFPEATLFHLPRTSSDHCPILLDLKPFTHRTGSRPFRMEKFWLDHPEFQALIQQIWSSNNSNTSDCLDTSMKQARIWSRNTFGNIFKRKQKLLSRLAGIQKSTSYNFSHFLWNLEKELIQEFERVLKLEEDLWFMKSRTNWIVEGDRNTKFFHLSTIKHRSKNRILGLKNLDLFSTTLDHSFMDSFRTVQLSIDESLSLDSLSGIPSEVEILRAVNSMKPYKAPGPDGTHPFFYQKLWAVVKDKVCNDIKQIFQESSIPEKWNECLLVLIPKVKSPETIQQYRPIGLCNTSYKIISKILVHRLKPWMDKLISPCQSSFIPGRQGMDNVLILQELVYSFKKKTGKVGDMICKLDLEKAYDRLEWSFIREALLFFKFPMEIINLIMSMVCSSSISVLVNGDKTESFLPTRGIRQGDPLSPYLFIICMEFLSLKISADMEAGHWKGSKAGRRGPLLSHLFFADDIIFIGKATPQNCVYLKNLLDFFCSRSGQRVNPAKSRIFFSKNVSINNRESLSAILGFPCTEDLGTYLGIPISAKKISKGKCQFIIDRVRAKLAGWKSRFLSLAGRVTLTSSVLAAIPNYYMQTMLLPASVHTELDQISRNFIWGSEDNQKKIHLVGWQSVTQPKDLGGLGLKSSKEANVAAMSKLNWRLYTEKDKLWCNIFRSKYNLSDCHSPLPASGSPIWKAIIKGYDIFKAGIKWIPQSGGNVRFWTDCWCCDIPLISWIYGPHTPGFELITVAEFFNVGASAADLIAYPIPIDIEPFIHAVPISLFALREDTFAWVGSSNGSFSSASAYCITKHLPLKPLEDWRWVWKSYTYPKIQYFLWLLAHDRLKCFSYLHRLGIISSPLCPLCHLEDETVEHLIRSCPISVVILSDVLPVVFCFAVWGIWLHRNQLIHRSNPYGTAISKRLILEKASKFWAGQSLPTPPSRGSSFFKWSKPLSPFIKLNTDGSVLGNPGGAASGGLFRDHNGSWILGFARKIGITSSLAAELWALRDGLALAVTYSYSHLIVETDSSTAFNFMMNTACVSHPLSSLILDCRDLLRLISYVQIFHIKRQSNMAADQIARMGHSLQQDFVVLPHCPVNVKLLCILDIMGYEFPRNNYRSGQRVNPAKSKIFFSKNVSINNRESLSAILGFPCTEDLGTYLGRVTLTSSVLAAIPNYYMQTMLLPASVHTELDQISRNFIWGLEDNQKKIHLVGWQTVTQPKDLGGLGLKSSKEANVAAMSKLNWRLYMEKDKLWCNIFRSKYNLSDCHSPLPASGSPIWKAIIKGYDIFKAGIKWIPRSGGNVRFWTDCWCCDIPLISWIYGPHTPGFELITVAEFFNVGASAADLIAYPIPIDIEPFIHAVPISLFALREDTFAWVGSSNGSFSSASAYCITKHLPLKPLEDWRWGWGYPSKIANDDVKGDETEKKKGRLLNRRENPREIFVVTKP